MHSLSLFLSLLPWVPKSSSISNMFYIWVCICLPYTIYIYIYMFFWLYLPHMKGNMLPLSFWAWLTSFNILSSKFIHLPLNHTVPMAE
jgi:hypothetical protein